MPMATPRAELPSDTSAVPESAPVTMPEQPASDQATTPDPAPTTPDSGTVPGTDPSEVPLPIVGAGLLTLGLVQFGRRRRAS